MTKTISMNSKVTVKCNNVTKTFQLVRSENIDSSFSKISNESPLGQLLVGSKAKDIVKVKTPSGTTEYEIISVESN